MLYYHNREHRIDSGVNDGRDPEDDGISLASRLFAIFCCCEGEAALAGGPFGVLLAALSDAQLAPERVEEIILGNANAGGNPARLIALAAGLPETASALTIDRQCGSGLDAILAAIRTIVGGEADVIVAGGAESLSTAPWRIAKPKSLHQLPHFI